MFSRRDRPSRSALATTGGAPRVSTPHFSAWLAGGRGYAVVVGKKTLRKAIDRNRLTRRILGILRKQVGTPPPPPALVIYPRAAALALSATELSEELAALRKQASMR